jgi:hypothetical protein
MSRPAALFGMELAPDTLPADVPEAAARLAAAGKLRDALSLLYRGALSSSCTSAACSSSRATPRAKRFAWPG